MSARLLRARVVAALALACATTACSPAAGSPAAERTARNTLVIGIDISGSFLREGRYESAVDFAAQYIYAHLHGLGGLKKPTALFVGTVGGDVAGETKSFQPIHTFQSMSVDEIRAYLRREYPARDGLTDFNPFFTRVATLVKRQNLVLSPINVVIFTDGLPDAPAAERRDTVSRYRRIDVSPLEYLSRSVTVRVLYPSPTIAVRWEKTVPRRRVRMWTVDNEVMTTWRKHYVAGAPPEKQEALWKWVADNVDFRVRSVGVM
ncbi:MAG TPA: hypothetical protein VNA89_11850 [Gemmatimonadaceae bacterium]|nr:hypothetical protein [Gemmatimonadaceae bacterium]